MSSHEQPPRGSEDTDEFNIEVSVQRIMDAVVSGETFVIEVDPRMPHSMVTELSQILRPCGYELIIPSEN